MSGTTLAEVASFLAAERYPIIVKPTESAGSDGVKRCVCREAAEAHFELLMRSQHRYGSAGAAVICQEFLTGTEYVVDHVSRHGVHRTVMVWRYDRRPNGSGDFVEFNMLPVPSDAPEVAGLVAYTRGVLDAIAHRCAPRPDARRGDAHDGWPMPRRVELSFARMLWSVGAARTPVDGRLFPS